MYRSLALLLAAMTAGSSVVPGNISNQARDARGVDTNQYINASVVGSNHSDAIERALKQAEEAKKAVKPNVSSQSDAIEKAMKQAEEAKKATNPLNPGASTRADNKKTPETKQNSTVSTLSDAIANLNLGNKVEVSPKAGVDKAVAIKISYENESMDDAAQKFIQQINTIFANCNVEDGFNYVSFQAEFHKNASAFLTFYNYGGPDSDYTTEMFTFGNMPKFESAYKNSELYTHDKTQLFESSKESSETVKDNTDETETKEKAPEVKQELTGDEFTDSIINLNLGNKVEVTPKTEADKAVTIKLCYDNESMDEAADEFVEHVSKILDNCNVENSYNYIQFQAQFHTNSTVFLTFYNYGGPDSDYTTEMFTFGNMPEFENAYKNSKLYSHDKGNLFK